MIVSYPADEWVIVQLKKLGAASLRLLRQIILTIYFKCRHTLGRRCNADLAIALLEDLLSDNILELIN